MGQIIISSWKQLFRSKFNMFWILLFPIALGTLFYIAFSNLGQSESMHAIPVAVVADDDDYGNMLEETINSMKKSNPDFLKATFCGSKKARKLLENGNVYGIIESGQNIKLSISANMPSETLNQSILQSFVEEYNLRSALLMDIMTNQPQKMPDVVKEFNSSITYNKEISLQKNPNIDTYTQYYYNQLAMACLYAAMAGVLVAVNNQSNLSALAARKAVSSTKKYHFIIGELFAATIFEFIMNLFGFLYLAYVLKVGVDAQLPFAILALFVGVMTGVSIGFFFGTIGKKGKEEKDGLIFAVIMPMCFLSGLMIGNMRILVDDFAPIINKINPAALITDSLYCLSIFEGHARYFQNLTTLFVFSIILITLGILKTRRSTYASI